jgi:acyl dehydratase
LPDSEPGAQRGWFLEDAIPGTTLRHPGGRTIDEAEHVWLAWITDNVSDVHGNADAASRAAWGQPIVLGALSAAIVIGLAHPGAGDPATTGTAGWSDGWELVKLTATVLPGDTLMAESRIHAVSAEPGAPTGRVRRTIIGRNQRGEPIATIDEEREVPRRG